MENENLVRVRQIIEHYKIEDSFLRSLNEFGLVEIIRVEEEECVNQDCLAEVERMARLHYELDINLAGIDAISHLLRKMHEMQVEMTALRNRLASF